MRVLGQITHRLQDKVRISVARHSPEFRGTVIQQGEDARFGGCGKAIALPFNPGEPAAASPLPGRLAFFHVRHENIIAPVDRR
jgi:hypothetical protein